MKRDLTPRYLTENVLLLGCLKTEDDTTRILTQLEWLEQLIRGNPVGNVVERIDHKPHTCLSGEVDFVLGPESFWEAWVAEYPHRPVVVGHDGDVHNQIHSR